MGQSTQVKGSRTSPADYGLLVLLVLLAFALRFYAPEAAPPGLSHDELRMMQLGELIVDGERPIHWMISYSAEPLYMYLLAAVMPVMGFTAFGARLVTRFAGVLLIPLAFVLARRWFGRRPAFVTAALLAVTWWPLFFSRVALRGITLPFVFALSLVCLWFGVQDKTGRPRVHWPLLVTGGLLLGLTWYTFTAARALFFVWPAFILMIWVLKRPVSLTIPWKAALLTVGLGCIVAAPFVIDMQVNPGAPEARLEQLGDVLDELWAGHLTPFVRQAAATVGMLGITGDPNWRYNVADRPIFGPVLGILAVIGIVVSLVRWKRPEYLLLLLWLALGWAPAMLTPEAPSFVRAIGALPAVVMLPGIGLEFLTASVPHRAPEWARRGLLGLVVLLVVRNGVATARDYFVGWPTNDSVREIYQASLTRALEDLESSTVTGTVWAAESFPDDRHLMLAERLQQRPNIDLRWFDAQRALPLPASGETIRYLLADFSQPDPVLAAEWLVKAQPVLAASDGSYSVVELTGGEWSTQQVAEISANSRVAFEWDQLALEPPVRFGETVTYLGHELAKEDLATAGEVVLIVFWAVDGPVSQPLTSFAHLITVENRVIGQYDGLDVPPWEWSKGLIVAQEYRFAVDVDAAAGQETWLEVGLYDSQTMERVSIADSRIPAGTDRLLLVPSIFLR